MASFFDDDEKNAVEELFDDLHDTFKRTIYAFVEEASFVDFQSDFNSTYNRRNNQSKGLPQRVKYEIEARIFHERWNPDDVDNDTGLPTSENIVRLKVTPADHETLKKASVIEVDGDTYSLISDDQKIGPFSVNYHEVWLRRNT